VQIVDALIDFFRDIMVAKTAGKDSKVLILTAEQKERTSELAELFDIAALVYNITALEKLRWTIKTADSPRPLLEASILRFALSEHFLNVDQLLSNKNASSEGSVKKNKIIESPSASAGTKKFSETAAEQIKSLGDVDRFDKLTINLQSIKANWPGLLNSISQIIGNGTTSLLTRAVPTRLEDDVLTITFDASAKMQKKMCESNGRIDQIQTVLSNYLKKDIKVRFELGDSDQSSAGPAAAREIAQKQRENVIASDPAVKTIVTELGATITGIEGLTDNY
jgi:DNA polymerase III gamma/tau subunit